VELVLPFLLLCLFWLILERLGEVFELLQFLDAWTFLDVDREAAEDDVPQLL